ncbi:enolase C-terminal domain-like protein [Nonomuraea jabiensis]|uniref:enolase C-terminal domain-like protein n=1 Tax=Nonomuraea jabiensis TaxID=882448 RepID=UPI0036BBB0DA
MPTDPPAPMGHDLSRSYRGLLTERIARQLEHDIRAGKIRVGTKLPSERELAAQFGGVSPLRKLFDFAAQHQIKSAVHGPEDISPVGMAAAIHLDLAIHNFGIQEYAGHTALTHEVFPHAYTFTDGYLHPGEAPGLGIELDEELASAYPYEPAYLPINRLQDGTIHDW